MNVSRNAAKQCTYQEQIAKKMAKEKTIFRCLACGGETLKWMGQCPDCGQWDTLEQAIKIAGIKPSGQMYNSPSTPVPIGSIDQTQVQRRQTSIAEFDRVLGGGIVTGSLVLIGGDPGIGKSTLMLQVVSYLAKHNQKCLYVSGEESLRQIALRASRLNSNAPSLLIVAETNITAIKEIIRQGKYDAVVIDSIQTVFHPEISATPGSVTQVREASMQFMRLAKTCEVPIFLVGHVTKGGSIAGPRIMEHMVDTVLYFEGDKSHIFRILRSVKNRFGATNEIGVFEMQDKGLSQVPNPSAVFLSERSSVAPGAVVTASMEGSRPILVEIQGLVAGNSTGGSPRRTILGVDSNRVALIVAVIEKRLEMNLGGLDIFMNVTGGVKIIEPAADLAIAAGLISSFLDRPLERQTLLIGEIGLTGEIRAVGNAQIRIKEAAKMGFTTCIVPANTTKQLTKIKGIKIKPVKTLKEAVSELFNGEI